MKIIKIHYNCYGCGQYCETTNHNMRYRQHCKNEQLCQKCIIRRTKSAVVFQAVPEKYHELIYAGIIPFDIAIKNLQQISTDIKVEYYCENCDKHVLIRWSKQLSRQHGKYEQMCYSCLQSLIHNSPDYHQAHVERSKKLWQNEEYRQKGLRAFQEHNLRMSIDPIYASKHKRRSRSISGVVILGDRRISFDSAFELFYIHYAIDNYAVFRRCEFIIPYNGHHYHPDFFIIDATGKRSIIEVKGYYNNDVQTKEAAAQQFIITSDIADEYLLYTTAKLQRDGILLGVGGYHMWKQIRGICDVRIVRFAEEKHREIARIGPHRYYKNQTNQKNREAALYR